MYNPYHIPINVLNMFELEAIICQYNFDLIIYVIRKKVNKIQNSNKYSRKKKKIIFYNIVAAITYIEKNYNILINPDNNHPWINLINYLQQLVGIFDNNYKPNEA